MAEAPKRISEKDARFLLHALQVEGGFATGSEELEAFGIVTAHFEEALAKGEFVNPSLLGKLRGNRFEEKPIRKRWGVGMPYNLTETAVSGTGWRAFDLSRRGQIVFQQDGLPETYGFFSREPLVSSSQRFTLGGEEDGEASCFLGSSRDYSLDVYRRETEVAIAREFNDEQKPYLALMVFRDAHEAGRVFLELIDRALLTHYGSDGKDVATFGLEHLNGQGSAERSLYVRLTSPSLAEYDHFEITKMEAIKQTSA